jgi:hypothetical protein
MSIVAADAGRAAPTFEAATYRKVARRLVPFLFALYVINFLDRANISYAKLQMSADLGFSRPCTGWARNPAGCASNAKACRDASLWGISAVLCGS